ncbi:D-alanine--poly(phosphoribitol) ligase subunit DltA [Vagococcus salmoninarum]|uniref:D-alanine--D-alanyl carrier protein ligase n=1 Tax=Vagococcus salmoninarum TaxID=2739 RepID=A0A429ZH53_9ENTE|nr:D-alanine--poly(phosphoribitol) ligase subunit DltA [Vagococcus salmoninarum]RST93051.1 D-alanine--poly(phosphoribitol) ligase subunit 1 [Vagococcus salmoninarum]
MEVENIIQTIDQWAINQPEAVCFKDADQSYTYQELKVKSDRLASYLLSQEDNTLPVIVYGGLEFEMIVTFLGCSKAGHAYIPIDSQTPADRVKLITEVADYTKIIAWDEWPLATNSVEVIERQAGSSILTNQEIAENFKPVKGAENYYIIFTSGTTGVPKGVQISHDNLVSYSQWMLNDFGLSSGLSFLSQAPYSFDLSVMDVYPALLSGGHLVPLKKELINDFKQLFTVLPELSLNVWVSTPSFADICLMDPRFNGDEMASLSHFLFCGEELTHQTGTKLKERFPKARIFNTYGPTEATVAVTELEITAEVLANYPRLPIGRVKADTKIYIMADTGEVLPEGQVGEIVIAGPSVSKGYFNNPEKTAEAFFLYEGQPAYRTGDAGLIQNGILSYQGRLDFQIKLHGYRIELEDIDHHLSEVSYVQQAAVVPKYQEHKVQQLVAYVVANPHDFAKDYQLTKAIKAELKGSVMDYMIPQKFVYVTALPLTQNGKVDRKGLINEVNS